MTKKILTLMFILILVVGSVLWFVLKPFPFNEMEVDETRYVRVNQCYRVGDDLYTSTNATTYHFLLEIGEHNKAIGVTKKEGGNYQIRYTGYAKAKFLELESISLEKAKAHLSETDPNAKLQLVSENLR